MHTRTQALESSYFANVVFLGVSHMTYCRETRDTKNAVRERDILYPFLLYRRIYIYYQPFNLCGSYVEHIHPPSPGRKKNENLDLM